MQTIQSDWQGASEPGTVVVREGHAGKWKVWDGKPVFNSAGTFFGRLVEMTTPTNALIDMLPPAEPAPADLSPTVEPETPEGD